MTLEIIDNFLDQDYFEYISGNVLSCNFPWLYESRVAHLGEDKDKDYYFTHRLYEDFEARSSFFNELLQFFELLKVKSLIRARALLYVNQGEQIIHDKHIDFNYEHKTALYYLNTNNGFTELEDGTRVESIANRLVIFDGSKPHNSSTCTDAKVRSLLSINYF